MNAVREDAIAEVNAAPLLIDVHGLTRRVALPGRELTILDDVSFRSQTALAAGGQAVANAIVAFNKRLNDRLSLVYEQGITVATNVLRLEYTLTQSITLRAETGTASGLGIAYRRSFD